MAGKSLQELGFTEEVARDHYSVKEAVFPFLKFPGIDTLLGPEMLSTGEVMGISDDFGMAFAKSQMAAGNSLPVKGTVFISVKDADKDKAVDIAKQLADAGFKILATKGTCAKLDKAGIKAKRVLKITEGRPNIVDTILNGQVDLIINTTVGKQSILDSYSIRRSTLDKQVPYVTTMRGAWAVVRAIASMKKNHMGVKPIQKYYE